MTWNALVEHIGRVETLHSVMGTLGWDEQTMMPPKGAALRGSQRALLAEIAHEWLTDPRIEGWLSSLETDEPVRAACARNLGRSYRRERNVPPELVVEMAKAESEGFAAWLDAKKNDDFSRFSGPLTRVLDLSRRRAEAIDPHRHPYEVLLEQFDPGTDVDGLRATFSRLRDGLTPLLAAIADRPPLAAITRRFEPTAQERLHRAVATALGYDFEAGRLDHAEHPFTSGMGAGDVRITTHIVEDDLLNGLGSTIHEVGHGLYEQGLPHDHRGTTVAEAASHGLHESQSRFWENYIGRSEAFSGWLATQMAEHMPEAGVTAEELFHASNRVERGLIRVKADEVTYNLHIIVRFEIELALFEGRLTVAELPEAWNARYAEYLGVTPPTDAEGVLQDVHWAAGAFGYFPSYTLGNLYAASLGATLEEAQPDLWQRVAGGHFSSILGFLRERVHRHGHLREAPEIMRAAVGDRDHVEDLLAYLWRRVGGAYGVERPAGR